MTDPRQHAHQLIERLDPGEILAVVRYLEFMTLPPVVRAIATAPPDDEPVTVEDRQAIARAEAWFESRGGKGIPMEDVLADFGLTMDDFPLDTERRGV